MSYVHRSGVLSLVAIAILAGCSGELPEVEGYTPELKDDPPRPVVWEGVTEIPNPLASETPSRSRIIRTYEHKGSGVSVVFPDGWKVTIDEGLHDITTLDFDRDEATVTITFYRVVIGSEAGLYEDKLEEYAEMYGSKLKRPRQIKVGDQHGYQVQATPPLLYGYEPKTHHCMHSFFVVEAIPQTKPRGEIESKLTIRKWMICVDGYANEDKLHLVNEVLHSIRWRRPDN